VNNNLAAFLTLIRTGEGTLGEAGYRTLYGGGTFDAFYDHPRTKVKAGKWTSSAAGAYQILERTWDVLVKANPWTLTDFTPDKQDEAAILLIKGRGAYEDVIAGRFTAAIAKCAKEWASLPGSPYGQPTLKLDKALAIIKEAGGTFAETTEAKVIPPFIIPVAIELIKELPNFAKIFKKDDVSERNVEAIVKATDVVVNAVGAVNAQEAVEKIKGSPEVAQIANEAVKVNTADLMDSLERLNALEQGNIASARTFNAGEKEVYGKFKFIHLLSAMLVLLGGGAAVYILATSTESTERAMALQTLLIVGFAGVANFWLGSSDGSAKKTELLKQRDT
jgi:muramidase (phage lysozyme)